MGTEICKEKIVSIIMCRYCAIIMCTIHCVLHIVYYTLCTIHCVLHIVYYTLFTTHCVLHIVYYTLCTTHCILYIVYYTLCTTHCVDIALDVALNVPRQLLLSYAVVSCNNVIT